MLNLRPISSVFLPTVDTGGREAKVTLALLMEGYSNFSISLLTTWNMSPLYWKILHFRALQGTITRLKNNKKWRLNYLQLVHYFFDSKGLHTWALRKSKYLELDNKRSSNCIHVQYSVFIGKIVQYVKNNMILVHLQKSMKIWKKISKRLF